MSIRYAPFILPLALDEVQAIVTGHILSLRHKLAHKLTKEIAAVLVFKAVFLAALYLAFFANPAPREASGILFSPVASTMPAGTR